MKNSSGTKPTGKRSAKSTTTAKPPAASEAAPVDSAVGVDAATPPAGDISSSTLAGSSSSTAGRRLRLEYVEAGSLAENPLNWRKHPEGQTRALRGILSDPEIGWAGACLYNEQTGRLIDGHARRNVVDPHELVPVLIGSWSPAAEKKILATLDPLAGMAEANADALAALRADVTLSGDDFKDLAADLDRIIERSKDAGGGGASGSGSGQPLVDQYKIIVTCKDEMHQTELLDRFDQEGLECKALVG
jgi:hypothetical protein